ncbi:MAG: helix-turn-helix transcriptional regulator [Alphaproteobacteria bacterium]|jgi:transcriptional regulator with XRE-family HTH domain|nr:helix-turn-helix transcriptional regulator [Alphaproteobacteria bacterium]
MRSGRANITKAVLFWAREKAGYSEEDAARKIQVKVERYQAWENEDEELKPTVKQLRRIAKLYKRPVSLYLPRRIARRFPANARFSPTAWGWHSLLLPGPAS